MLYDTAEKIYRMNEDSSGDFLPFDGADLYVTETLILGEGWTRGRSGRCMILGDRFGGLSLPLAPLKPDLVFATESDRKTTLENLGINGLECGRVSGFPDIPPGPYDLIVIRIPKDRLLWETLLEQAVIRLAPGGRIIAGGVTKHLFPRIDLDLKNRFSRVQRPLARKKARIFWADSPVEGAGTGIWPRKSFDYQGMRIEGLAGVYSGGRLDSGSNLFLSVFDRIPERERVIDLGCGNGILGLSYKRRFPGSDLTLSDNSFLAGASAGINMENLGISQPWKVVVADLLKGEESGSADLILCNPPFHQDHRVTDAIARAMFRDAARVLVPGGELWVVGNRHLGYHRLLKKDFQSVTLVASDRRFVVLRCRG